MSTSNTILTTIMILAAVVVVVSNKTNENRKLLHFDDSKKKEVDCPTQNYFNIRADEAECQSICLSRADCCGIVFQEIQNYPLGNCMFVAGENEGKERTLYDSIQGKSTAGPVKCYYYSVNVNWTAVNTDMVPEHKCTTIEGNCKEAYLLDPPTCGKIHECDSDGTNSCTENCARPAEPCYACAHHELDNDHGQFKTESTDIWQGMSVKDSTAKLTCKAGWYMDGSDGTTEAQATCTGNDGQSDWDINACNNQFCDRKPSNLPEHSLVYGYRFRAVRDDKYSLADDQILMKCENGYKWKPSDLKDKYGYFQGHLSKTFRTLICHEGKWQPLGSKDEMIQHPDNECIVDPDARPDNTKKMTTITVLIAAIIVLVVLLVVALVFVACMTMTDKKDDGEQAEDDKDKHEVPYQTPVISGEVQLVYTQDPAQQPKQIDKPKEDDTVGSKNEKSLDDLLN